MLFKKDDILEFTGNNGERKVIKRLDRDNFIVQVLEDQESGSDSFKGKIIKSEVKKEWFNKDYNLLAKYYELYKADHYEGADNLIELLTKLEDKFKT